MGIWKNFKKVLGLDTGSTNLAEMHRMTLGSLFDGSAGFPLGGMLCGITPVWASEIEPFPIRVTTKRIPFMKHLGDISKIKGSEIEPVDIITFGSPCTDMSVAGKREGLTGKQSVLFYEAVRIVREMREKTDGRYPKYIIWENVTGAFSSNKGKDFREVLEEIARIKSADISVPAPEKWNRSGCIMGDDLSIAWRTFDARYWGVPQRRRRIYLVADLDGRRAGKILFESEGVSGYSHEGFKAWQRTAGSIEESADITGCMCLNDQGGERMDVTEDVASTLRAGMGGHPPLVSQPNCMNSWDTQQSRVFAPEGVAPTLAGADGGGGRNPAGLLFAAGVVSKGDGDCFLTPETHTSLTGGGGQAGQGYPCVLTAGFCGSASADARGIGYQAECSPTIKTGTAPSVLCLNDQGGERMDVTEDMTATLRAAANHPPLVFENHSQDSRYTGPLSKSQTVLATFGTGGNNQPFVVETPKTLKIRSGCDGGGKGPLIQDDKSATLGTNNDQTLFQPKVYGICSKTSHSMLSDNPKSGFYEAETTRTLDANGGSPVCNQGGMAVVEPVPFTQNQRDEVRTLGDKTGALNAAAGTKQQTYILQGAMIGRSEKNGPQGSGVNKDVSFTLDATDRHAVAYGKDRLYTASKASFFMSAHEKVADTLVATDYKDPPLINDKDGADYIVRRLTPTECARLQGFPDWWCSDLGTEDVTAADIRFWREVFETHRVIVTGASKPKTDKQIVKWLKDPHSDSAEYKMWGNGVALPNVCFVLAGIVHYSSE